MILPFRSRFFIFFLIVFALCAVLWLPSDYGDGVLWVNARRSLWLDILMPWVTLIGDGWFYALVTVLLLMYRRHLGLFFALAGMVQGVISFLLKRVVFGPVPRPTRYFESLGIELDLIPEVVFARLYSFPSGHTMTVFMLAALLALTLVRERWHPALLIAAIGVAYSRVYLLQHFFADVLAGAVVGVMLASILYTRVYLRWFSKQG